MIKVGFAVLDQANTYHALVAKYFERECKNRGIEVMILDDKFDGQTAINNCQLIVDSGCDAYISVLGYQVSEQLSQICKDAGVLAIGMDQPIEDFPYFGADPIETGKMAGNALVDGAIEKWGENPTIDLYIGLESSQGGQLNVDRMLNGYIPAIQARLDVPEEKIVHCDVTDNDSQVAQRLVEDTINAHPEAKHILIGGYVDDCGQGAEAVVEKLNMQDNVVITTIDGGSLAVNNFSNPNTSWIAAAALTPEMYGYYILNFIEPYLKGETDELSDRLVYPTLLITKDNYKEALEDLIQPIYPDYSIG